MNQNDKNQKNFRQNSAKEIQTGYLPLKRESQRKGKLTRKR
jgi:hypothetical protein